MASKEKKSGGDFVLESRHLVGLFLLLVVIFGVVFTLGYLLGRSQYDSKVRAAVGPPPGSDAPAAPAGREIQDPAGVRGRASPEKKFRLGFLSFRRSASGRGSLAAGSQVCGGLGATRSGAQAGCCFVEDCKTGKTLEWRGWAADSERRDHAPGRGRLHQDDALALAQALQQKKFPAFVIPPGADKLFRVQVGPYPDNQSASNARQELEAKGFKSIIKR